VSIIRPLRCTKATWLPAGPQQGSIVVLSSDLPARDGKQGLKLDRNHVPLQPCLASKGISGIATLLSGRNVRLTKCAVSTPKHSFVEVSPVGRKCSSKGHMFVLRKLWGWKVKVFCFLFAKTLISSVLSVAMMTPFCNYLPGTR
jgi:hypothetical protein